MLENLPNFESVPQLMASPGMALAVGAVLLLWGNKLFHVLLGAAGFLVGWTFVQTLGLAGPPWLELAGGLIVGFFCVALAFFVKKLALTVAGAVLGGLGGVWALQTFAPATGAPVWAVGLVGAILGAVLLHGVFNVGLAAISSWLGAGFVLQAVPLEPSTGVVVGLVLVLFGTLFQLRGGRDRSHERVRERKRERRHERRLRKIEKQARRRARAAG